MRYSSLLALCAFMLCLNTPEVRGEILAVHTYDVMTHTALLPKPVASGNVFKLAATWWLPDWQGSQGSRGSTDDGGGDIDGECETYGYVSECNAPKTSGGMIYPISGLACHKSCSCSGNFQYTSSNCSGKYKLSGNSCDGKYSDCVCNDTFIYDASNCNGENKLGGEICNGKYNSCTLRPECTVSSKDCTYGCAEYNSCDRCTSCKPNPDCDVSDKSCDYGCASYNSCSKCTSCKSNPDCSATAVSCDYGCASTNSCGICTSCAGNPDCDVADKSCDYGCAATNSCGKCTECKSCSNACDSGYSLTACSSSQVQTASKTNQCGNSCYSCRAKTCAEQGKKDCNGSCINTSECCGGCTAGFECKDGVCTNICGQDEVYEDEIQECIPGECVTARESNLYMRHDRYMSCPYSSGNVSGDGDPNKTAQEKLRLCCGYYGKNSNWGYRSSVSCPEGVYMNCEPQN